MNIKVLLYTIRLQFKSELNINEQYGGHSGHPTSRVPGVAALRINIFNLIF
jgi:hypothetical protein